MNTQLLKTRQTKFATYVVVYSLIIIAVVVIANVLADRYNKSYDGTANKRFSLSDQTKKIVAGLQQDATITYYNQSTSFEGAKDLFAQYSNLSGRIHTAFVDPDKNPQVAREAGIKDLGVAVVQIGEHKEQAKSLNEEGLTGAFIRLLKNKTRTICFVTGSGEHQLDDSDRHGFSSAKDLLSRDGYAAQQINLLQKAEVPGECTVVVVAGPNSDYQQPSVDALQKYVEGGGRALFMLDPPLKVGRPTSDNETLDKVLVGWGVTLDKNLVLDLNPIGQIMGLGPQVVIVLAYDTHPIVGEMKGLATGFPLSRSMDIKNGDKTTVQKLFSSTDSTLATTNLAASQISQDDPKNKKGPFILAAAGSYNVGKENAEGRFVVFGSSSWAENSFISFKGNPDLWLNAMNWLSSDEDLISIRPKDVDDRQVTMTQGQFRWVVTVSQFLFPLLIISIGLTVWWKRR